jgi:hypothetical protein
MLDGSAAPGQGESVPHAVLHGLFWLLADRAADEPLLLAIDDAQWADETSMAWLRYAARRVPELPVAVLVATRPGPGRRRERASRGCSRPAATRRCSPSRRSAPPPSAAC